MERDVDANVGWFASFINAHECHVQPAADVRRKYVSRYTALPTADRCDFCVLFSQQMVQEI